MRRRERFLATRSCSGIRGQLLISVVSWQWVCRLGRKNCLEVVTIVDVLTRGWLCEY